MQHAQRNARTRCQRDDAATADVFYEKMSPNLVG
jgi:hypothetical protein